MAIEYIDELEQKIDAIIAVVQELKNDKSKLSDQIQEQVTKIESLETENSNLAGQIGTIQGSNDDRQQKIDTAAAKIQALLAKLEAVEK